MEPVESMRNTLAAKNLQGVNVCEGLATKINLPDEWADGVIVAQVCCEERYFCTLRLTYNGKGIPLVRVKSWLTATTRSSPSGLPTKKLWQRFVVFSNQGLSLA